MLESILDYLFGCRHQNRSFPFTARGSKRYNRAASVTGTYVVCLDCGKEFPYDWRAMKVVTMPRETPAATPIGETANETLARSA